MMSRSRPFLPLAATLAAAMAAMLLPACSGGSASAGFTGGTGSVQVHLTDAPLDLSQAQSVMVTIEAVILYPADDPGTPPEVPPSGPIPLMTHPDTFDLLTLTGGATTLLASGEVPAGRYERIRLEVSHAELVWMDGSSESLKLESGKVDVPIPFDLGVGESEEITLDFDAAASVKVNETASDTLILRPVVTPID